MEAEQRTQVEFYTSPDGLTRLEVRADGETVWLNHQQLAVLFGRDVKTIGKHVGNALKEELEGIPVVAKFATTADVVAGFLPSLKLLRDYDEGDLGEVRGRTPSWALTLDGARVVIARVGDDFPSDSLFGLERGDALAGVIGTIYQGFSGRDLYSTIEEKVANLLYLVVKDHPLADGNKRSGAALFVTFLNQNSVLEGRNGTSISNNALAAITLLVAMSAPKEKELMIALIVRMIAESLDSTL